MGDLKSSPRILVIEDEPWILMAAAEYLADAGYQVEEAANAAEGLAKILSDSGSFDAIIIDLGLPDRTGDLVATEIRALHPTLPIVIASGQDGAALTRYFSADPLVRTVPKPYGSNALPDALSALGVKAAS